MSIPHTVIAANAPQIAATILRHPVALLLTEPTVHALADIVVREPGSASAAECRLLSEAITFVEAVEIAVSREASR